jgi:hypothetical protein
MTKQPNILFITCHDLGKHLGCYGQQTVNSPALDQLSNIGVQFDNCFFTAPQCSPSRASLHTGQKKPIELYDLVNDPGETKNLCGDPETVEIEASLAKQLVEWMQASHDPVLSGPVASSPYNNAIKKIKEMTN